MDMDLSQEGLHIILVKNKRYSTAVVGLENIKDGGILVKAVEIVEQEMERWSLNRGGLQGQAREALKKIVVPEPEAISIQYACGDHSWSLPGKRIGGFILLDEPYELECPDCGTPGEVVTECPP